MKESIPSKNAKGDLPVVWFGDIGRTQKGLVVVQEWWGMNQQIQDQAQQISEDFDMVTMTPDLYRGIIAKDAEEAGHYMANLDWPGAVADIEACVKNLKSKGCKKVGVTGFCMGGALSLAAAVLVPELDASAPFYGIPKPEICDVSTIKIPLQCHFGLTDAIVGFSSVEDQKVLKSKLNAGGVPYEFLEYDAGHAFTNKSSPNYNQDATNSAFKKLREFFNAKL